MYTNVHIPNFQEVTYMFKKQTRQRPLYVGDHVLALPELGEIK